jgi:hypothetical protein
MAEINHHRYVENKYNVFIINIIDEFVISLTHIVSKIGTEEAFSQNTKESKRDL